MDGGVETMPYLPSFSPANSSRDRRIYTSFPQSAIKIKNATMVLAFHLGSSPITVGLEVGKDPRKCLQMYDPVLAIFIRTTFGRSYPEIGSHLDLGRFLSGNRIRTNILLFRFFTAYSEYSTIFTVACDCFVNSFNNNCLSMENSLKISTQFSGRNEKRIHTVVCQKILS